MVGATPRLDCGEVLRLSSNHTPNKTPTLGQCDACGYSPIEVREYERYGYNGRMLGDERNPKMRFKRICALCVATKVSETVDIHQSATHPSYEHAKVRQQINFVAHTILAALQGDK